MESDFFVNQPLNIDQTFSDDSLNVQSLDNKKFSRYLNEDPHGGVSAEGDVHAEGDAHAAGDAHGQGEAHAEHHHDTTKQDVTLFLFLCMFVGQLFKQLSGFTGIPYTSLITILGVFLGIYHESLGRIGVAI